jgi:rRNA maturation endonuclease Nob1
MKIIGDSSAFINGYEYCFQFETIYVVPEVFDEVKTKDLSMLNNIKVVNPNEDNIRKAKKIARKLKIRLSKVDIKILALALELKLPVATDDYKLQNALKYCNIEFIPVRFKGIERLIIPKD